MGRNAGKSTFLHLGGSLWQYLLQKAEPGFQSWSSSGNRTVSQILNYWNGTGKAEQAVTAYSGWKEEAQLTVARAGRIRRVKELNRMAGRKFSAAVVERTGIMCGNFYRRDDERRCERPCPDLTAEAVC